MPVKGIDSDALETLVRAFYTAECPLDLLRVPALYDAASKLEVSEPSTNSCDAPAHRSLNQDWLLRLHDSVLYQQQTARPGQRLPPAVSAPKPPRCPP